MEGALVDEVRGLFNLYASIFCQFAHLECNQVAYLLGKHAILSQDFQVWLEPGTLWIYAVVLFFKKSDFLSFGIFKRGHTYCSSDFIFVS